MTRLMRKVLEELAKLPVERQEELASMLLDIIKHEYEDFFLTPEQEEEVRASLAKPEFLSEEETAALYRRFGV